MTACPIDPRPAPPAPLPNRSPRWLAGLLLLAAAPALAGKAHEHGVARLDIGVELRRVTVFLESPLDNLVGFERAPRTDAERERVEAMRARLRAAGELLRIDGAAGCTPAAVVISAPVLDAAPPAAAGGAGHADLEARFDFECRDGARAGFVEHDLFEAFKGLRRIEVQLATPRGQMKATLARPAARITLVR